MGNENDKRLKDSPKESPKPNNPQNQPQDDNKSKSGPLEEPPRLNPYDPRNMNQMNNNQKSNPSPNNNNSNNQNANKNPLYHRSMTQRRNNVITTKILSDAFRNCEESIDKRAYYAHLKVLIISKKVLENHLQF